MTHCWEHHRDLQSRKLEGKVQTICVALERYRELPLSTHSMHWRQGTGTCPGRFCPRTALLWLWHRKTLAFAPSGCPVSACVSAP